MSCAALTGPSCPQSFNNLPLNAMLQRINCLHTFVNWRGLQAHINLSCCQAEAAFASTSQWPCPLSMSSRTKILLSFVAHPGALATLGYVDRQAWNERSFDEEVCAALKNACQLCGAWVGRIQELNRHNREHHWQVLVEAILKGAQIETAVRTDPPCRFCQKQYKLSHMCPVTLQAAVILLFGCKVTTALPMLACDVCKAGESHPHMSLHPADCSTSCSDWGATDDTSHRKPHQ